MIDEEAKENNDDGSNSEEDDDSSNSDQDDNDAFINDDIPEKSYRILLHLFAMIQRLIMKVIFLRSVGMVYSKMEKMEERICQKHL